MVLQQQWRKFKKKYPLPRQVPGGGIFNLTNFKLFALVCMILDHVHYIFSSFYDIPIQFKYIGRLAFPIFIFAAVEGYQYTSNKKKYMLRLLMFSAAMQLGNYLLNSLLPRLDGFKLQPNIFQTLFFIILYIWLIDNIKNKRNQVFSAFVIVVTLPLTLFVEYGTLFIILGVLMYQFRSCRAQQVFIYCIFSLLYINSYQFIMLAAAPLFIMYNGKKGPGLKYLFYIIYPLHLWSFYALSVFM